MHIERRTRGDLIAVAAIVIAVLAAATLVWWTSPERATTSITAAAGENASPADAVAVPDALTQAWREPSAATASPIALGATAVTADGNAVVGRDYETGEQKWLYERDIPLCGVVGAWDMAISVYRTSNGCSDVTALKGDTGARGPQRTSNNDDHISLRSNSTFVTAFGPTRLESWRNDLVRTLEYGRVDAPVNPGFQPRTGCELRSAATSPQRVAVLERCPDESGERLTSLKPDPADATKPEVAGSLILFHGDQPVEGARVLATTGDRTAVLVLAPEPTIVIYDALGATLMQTPLPPDALKSAVVQNTLGPAIPAGPILTFWTGSATVALNSSTLETLWTRPGTLGVGAMMAGKLLLPVAGGIAVADPWTGIGAQVIPVAREDGAGEVSTSVIGTVVLEQHNGQITAYE